MKQKKKSILESKLTLYFSMQYKKVFVYLVFPQHLSVFFTMTAENSCKLIG